MKVYTKTGDKGETGLFGGKRLSKDDLRIETYGTIDELNSWIGLLRDQKIPKAQIDKLIDVQNELFVIGSHLAADSSKKNLKLPLLDSDATLKLEQWIDELDLSLEPMKFFVLPGGHESVSYCHIARSCCRRAERRVVSLSQKENVHEFIIPYLNRLSDLLFTLSRSMTVHFGASEIPWNPRNSS